MPTDPTLEVSELFFSIQGESSYAGLPCVFIRTSGCNLRCNYCDAQYTYQEKHSVLSIKKIQEYTKKYPDAIVEITGGEPLMQRNTPLLAAQLVDDGRTVLVETNGSQDISVLPSQIIKIIDVKCPDSGMHQHNLLENLKHMSKVDELKFVLSSREDYDWSVSFIKEHVHTLKIHPHILMSSVPGRLPAEELAQWILTDTLNVRLQLQLHKFIWPEIERGV